MDCHEFKPLVANYLIGKLDAEELNSFAQHIIECSRCEVYILCLTDTAPNDCMDEKGGQNNVL